LNSLRALARRKYAKETTILLVLDRKGAAAMELRMVIHEDRNAATVHGHAEARRMGKQRRLSLSEVSTRKSQWAAISGLPASCPH